MKNHCCGNFETNQCCNDCPITAPVYPQPRPASAPAWHDAPTCAGLWMCDYFGEEVSVALFNDHEVNHFDRDEMNGCRWYGPIPQDKEGGAA